MTTTVRPERRAGGSSLLSDGCCNGLEAIIRYLPPRVGTLHGHRRFILPLLFLWAAIFARSGGQGRRLHSFLAGGGLHPLHGGKSGRPLGRPSSHPPAGSAWHHPEAVRAARVLAGRRRRDEAAGPPLTNSPVILFPCAGRMKEARLAPNSARYASR